MREPFFDIRAALAACVVAALLAAAFLGAPHAARADAAAVTGAPAGSSASVTSSNNSSEDIRDIRGPKWVLPDWLVPSLLAAAVLLALGVFSGWRWHRRRRRPRALLPFEIALQRLAEIRTLMQPSSAGEFSIAVSGIVRTYIEQQFDVTATLRTTEEFLRDLLESPGASLASHRTLLSEFLHQCDLAKFAGMQLTVQSMESLHQSACAFVKETGQPARTADAREEPRPSDDGGSHDSLPST